MNYLDIDKQTFLDLEIFGNEKNPNSVFGLFNKTKTMGGRKYLHKIIQNPLSDFQAITERSDAIKFIYDSKIDLTINSTQFDFIESYLNLNVAALRNNFVDAHLQNLSNKIRPQNDYFLIQSGIKQLIFLFRELKKLITLLSEIQIPELLNNQFRKILKSFENQQINELFLTEESFSCTKLNRYDYLLRKKFKNEVVEIVELAYLLDAFINVAKVARIKHFSFVEYSPEFNPEVKIEGLFHPLVGGAIPYDIEFGENRNLFFLTGPNMAGKSTFLKSVGLSVFLSHLGFPVPVSRMRTTIFKGLITTINLPDSINRGYSHYYAEVKRVKEAALKIKEHGRMMVIFDELFRGTNVKDAFDASLIIIESFSKIRNCTFYISTHLTEIAEKIADTPTTEFLYFDTELINDKPKYNYRLLKGVSHERLGLLILKNENVIEILNSVTELDKKQNPA